MVTCLKPNEETSYNILKLNLLLGSANTHENSSAILWLKPSLIPFGWSFVLNASIWELNCYM